ncbi:MAG: hypothetical protein ACRECY_17800 [Phyllobacterium sp.]
MVALAFVAVALGSGIPIYGLDIAALAEQLPYSSNGTMVRFSIFALGVIPLFTVLAYAEIAKLIVPPLAKWQAASSGNAYRMSLVIKVLILVLTAMQGFGILSALAAMRHVDGSASVMIAGITSFIGASAVMIWLADMVRLPGLGNGIWLLMAIPLLGVLPREVAALVELMRFGSMSAIECLILGVFIAIAIAMIVLANKLLSQKDDQVGEASLISSAVLLWPPFLANTIAGFLIAVPFALFPRTSV